MPLTMRPTGNYAPGPGSSLPRYRWFGLSWLAVWLEPYRFGKLFQCVSVGRIANDEEPQRLEQPTAA